MGEPLTELGPEYRTRPGTPVIGPYSTNQMDDFYAALGCGEVKTTGIMNYVQKMIIADRCEAGAQVVDICCGRGLQLPVLYRYAPLISSYVGLDIASANLAEAHQRIADLDRQHGGRPFDIQLIEWDVSTPWPDDGLFDVAVYTSALEHLPRELGIASLRNTAERLAPDGVLYLSTPNTTGEPPRRLQHRVHVYEWHHTELIPVLEEAGLEVQDRIGLLAPVPDDFTRGLEEAYGTAALLWYSRLSQVIPSPFLDIVEAAALPDLATEVLYVCKRR